MAYKKKTTAKKTLAAKPSVVKAPEAKTEPVKAPAPRKAKSKKYVSTKNRMYHPHQDVYLYPGAKGVMLKMDSWLKAQIEAGLVKVV